MRTGFVFFRGEFTSKRRPNLQHPENIRRKNSHRQVKGSPRPVMVVDDSS